MIEKHARRHRRFAIVIMFLPIVVLLLWDAGREAVRDFRLSFRIEWDEIKEDVEMSDFHVATKEQ